MNDNTMPLCENMNDNTMSFCENMNDGTMVQSVQTTADPAAVRFSQNLPNPLKIFAGLSKRLPMFILGTENIVG